jgi:hypothetical protein
MMHKKSLKIRYNRLNALLCKKRKKVIARTRREYMMTDTLEMLGYLKHEWGVPVGIYILTDKGKKLIEMFETKPQGGDENGD